jgi:trans-aconitate 2-methyltransferase
MTDTWDPAQYERFREERQQPFYDLLKLVIPKKGMRVVDLGCGTGELTREMHRQLKAASTLGIDSSASMLAKAPTEPGLSFQQGLIEEVTGKFDLVLSNAALHWIPDHRALIPKLAALVDSDGQLAIQMPANQDHPSHTVADAIAHEMGIEGVPRYLLPLEEYSTLLRDFRKQHVRMQVYVHRLPSREAVVEWVKGTTLTDIKRRLGERYAEFEERYRAALMNALPDEKPFFFTFKRIHLWAER